MAVEGGEGLELGVYTWGGADNHQLGRPFDKESQKAPMRVPLPLNVVVAFVACGDYHTMIISTDGAVFGWGPNNLGQIGAPIGLSESDEPYLIPQSCFNDEIVTNISCGFHHTVCCTDAGSVFGWGKNEYLETGIPEGAVTSGREAVFTPHRVPDLPVFVVSVKSQCASHHTGAIDSEGNLWLWGSNNSHQLGHQGTPLPPKKYHRPQVQQVAISYHQTLVLLTDGSLYRLCQTGEEQVEGKFGFVEAGQDEWFAICQDTGALCRGGTILPMSDPEDRYVSVAYGYRHGVAVQQSNDVHGLDKGFGGDGRSLGKEYHKMFQYNVIGNVSCGYYHCAIVLIPSPIAASTFVDDMQNVQRDATEHADCVTVDDGVTKVAVHRFLVEALSSSLCNQDWTSTGVVCVPEHTARDVAQWLYTAVLSDTTRALLIRQGIIVAQPIDFIELMRAATLQPDVTFIVGESARAITAHAVVLRHRCKGSMLSNMFESSVSTSDHIQLPDVDADAFQTLIWFLYTDTVLLDNMELAERIAIVADRFTVNRLFDLASQEIKRATEKAKRARRMNAPKTDVAALLEGGPGPAPAPVEVMKPADKKCTVM